MLCVNNFEITGQSLFEHYWVKRGTHKESNRQYFIQKFSLLQHYSSEIIRFVSSLMKLEKIKIDNLMNVAGFCIDNLDLYVFYDDDDFIPVNYNNLDVPEQEKLLTQVSDALLILHKYNIYHLALKMQFIFKDRQSNYRLGFIAPYPHDTIDPQDDILPLHDNKLCYHDIFLYGLLRAEVLLKEQRRHILERIWDLKSPLTQEDPQIDACLNLAAEQRPSFSMFSTSTKTYPESIDFSPSDLFKIIRDVKPIAGSCYLNGIGVEKDENKAKEIFASSNDPISLNDMAKFVIEESHEKALEYLTQSAECNFSVAMKNAGLIHIQDGRIKEGIHYLVKSANLGFHDAYLILADTFVRSNTQVAFNYIEMAAHRGDTRALVSLGLYYEHAWGCKQDFKLMAGNWVLAAKIGSEQALNNIGVHIDSKDSAMKLWANLKDPITFFNIGNILLKRGEQFYDQAVDMMRHSADAGYVPAMFNMALLLKEKNPEEADKWCKMAATAKANELAMEARMKDIATIAADSL